MTQDMQGGGGGLFGGIRQGIASIVQEEVDRRTAAATERAKLSARGAGQLAGAGALGLVAVGATVSLPIMVLNRFLPPWATAVVVAGASGAGARVLARRGLDELQTAAPGPVADAIGGARETAAERARETAAQAAGTVRDTATQAADTVRETASQAAETVRETASSSGETPATPEPPR